MGWSTLTLHADADYAEALGEALLEHGALSVDMLDADADTPDEQAIFGEPGEITPATWQHNRITALFDEQADVEAIFAAACQATGLDTLPPHEIGTLPENDWVRLTQSQFDPIRISDRLWIVPTWHQPSDDKAINIQLDPGLAFGTGSHPTTRLCLRWLDENIHGGEDILDYGCGSGILAIAALKLGAAQATGIDVDAQAVQSSIDNAAANQVSGRFSLPAPALSREFDLVVANILTNPLRMLAPLLAGSTRPGGRLVLSGILAEQAPEIIDIYRTWFDFDPPVFDEGWTRLSGRKRAP